MRKKGFTLIELLAVIVILAVVALISVPIIIGVVNKSKKGAFEDSAYGVISAIRIYYAEHSVEGKKADTFTFPSDTKLKINGTKPKLGRAILEEDGKVAIAVSDGKWCALKEFDEEKVRVIDYTEKTCKVRGNAYKDGTAVYYNPNTNKKCSKEEVVGSSAGTKSGCMKWYVFLDDGEKDTINMILDHNVEAITAGSQDIGVMNIHLRGATEGWAVTAKWMNTADVAKITGAVDAGVWPVGSLGCTGCTMFYLDGARGNDPKWRTQIANASNKSEYAWLFDNTYNCLNYGCNQEDNTKFGVYDGYMKYVPMEGYWTYYNADQHRVSNKGSVESLWGSAPLGGIRPVVSVPRSIFS